MRCAMLDCRTVRTIADSDVVTIPTRTSQLNGATGGNSPHRNVETRMNREVRRWLEVPSPLPKLCAYLRPWSPPITGISVATLSDCSGS